MNFVAREKPASHVKEIGGQLDKIEGLKRSLIPECPGASDSYTDSVRRQEEALAEAKRELRSMSLRHPLARLVADLLR